MTKRTPPQEPPPSNPLAKTWDEKIIDALEPYLPEMGGVTLILSAFVTIFGFLGLSESPFLNVWTQFWLDHLGWGAYAIFAFLILAGLHIALRRRRAYTLTNGQLVGVEFILFSILPLSYLFSGATSTNPFWGGGIIGFGLAVMPRDMLGILPTYFIYFSLIIWGVALLRQVTWLDVVRVLRYISAELRVWAGQIAPEVLPADPNANRPILEVRQGKVVVPGKTPAVQPQSQPGTPHPALPNINLLDKGQVVIIPPEEIAEKKLKIEQTLLDFGLPAEVVSQQVGPAITQFGVKPGHVERPGPDGEIKQAKVRVGQIASLNRDLALALRAARVRIEAPVPGKGIVGIEVPNSEISTVCLRSVLESPPYQKTKAVLPFALGQDVSGTAIIADVTRLPHMLVAGQTGAGKSVFMNALIACLVMNNTPDMLQFVMIDPKKVELIRFNGLPHMLGHVEVEGERIIGVLRWLTQEMDGRYQKLSEVGARNIVGYNQYVAGSSGVKKMPYIVAVVDELADLMVQFGGDVEPALCRLAQMARAVGIHLVVATQRPSTDVITGLIKANFPSRVSFAVASSIDSRVILDTTGAENLLGRGDMLYLSAEASSPVRIQGCFLSDAEIDRIVEHWKQKASLFNELKCPWTELIERKSFLEETDDLLERAIALAQKYDTLSTSMLQRRLRIGYPRAARMMETLFEMGLVEDPKTGGQTRKSLVDEETDDPLADFLRERGEPYRDYPDKPDFGGK